MNTTTQVDLRTCKKGDKLISKHGNIFYYDAPITTWSAGPYKHKIINPNQPDSYLSRTDSGHVFNNPTKRMEEDHDIVQIIPA